MLTIDEAIVFHRNQCGLSETPAFDQRLKRDYDGLYGMLPRQFNDEQKVVFLTAREHVFRINESLNFEITEIIEAINSWCEHYNNKSQPINIPGEIRKYIKQLGYYKYQSLLKKDELINKTLGEDARKTLKSIQQSFNRKGRKPDKLSQFIYQEIEKNPSLTESRLLALLITSSWIESVTDSKIKWKESNKIKHAASSGLKDRLHRAKQKYNSR